jgi:anti-sigma regulatory factor (Ser/Thr protein kinase)
MSTAMSERALIQQALAPTRSDLVRWPLMSVLGLGASPSVPARSRRYTRYVLADWGLPRRLSADAETVASELVTNALRATLALDPPQPIGLRLLAVPRQRLVVEAWDAHPGRPERREVPGEAEEGRGLMIVEHIASRWGTRRLSKHVKTVWAELLLS